MSQATEFNPYNEESGNQNVTVIKIGGSIAVSLLAAGLALLSIGGTAAILFLGPQLIESRAQASSAYARETAQTADREARVALEQVDKIRNEVYDHFGIKVPVKTALKGDQK